MDILKQYNCFLRRAAASSELAKDVFVPIEHFSVTRFQTSFRGKDLFSVGLFMIPESTRLPPHPSINHLGPVETLRHINVFGSSSGMEFNDSLGRVYEIAHDRYAIHLAAVVPRMRGENPFVQLTDMTNQGYPPFPRKVVSIDRTMVEILRDEVGPVGLMTAFLADRQTLNNLEWLLGSSWSYSDSTSRTGFMF